MNGPAYYNEIDPYCVQWLRNLIAAGHIAPGDVDDRSIRDVKPSDLKGYTQCHFFAGVGGWSLALRLSLWPDARPVWTGSCPCQPFSDAGKRQGVRDDRHLWPSWFALITECSPPIIFGEQVARAVGYGWLDAVALDLEAQGYAFGSSILPACAVSAPHERSRVWFVADASSTELRNEHRRGNGASRDGLAVPRNDGTKEPLAIANGEGEHALPIDAEMASPSKFMAHANRSNAQGGFGRFDGASDGQIQGGGPLRLCSGGLAPADTASERLQDRPAVPLEQSRPLSQSQRQDWWATEPSVGRVAHGVPGRVGQLRALGNAIVPQVAAEFIKAAM